MRYQIQIIKMVTEDKFEEGEVGLTTDHGEIVKLHVEVLADAPLEIAQFLGCEVDELTVFENRIEYQCLESGEGYQLTDNLMALWQEGKCKAYSVSYSCYLTEVWSNEVTNQMLTDLGLEES